MLKAGTAGPDGAAPAMPPCRTGAVMDGDVDGVVAGDGLAGLAVMEGDCIGAGAVTGFCPIAGGGANLGTGAAGAIPAAGDCIGAGVVTGFCPIAGGGANLGTGTAGAIPAAGDCIGGSAAPGRGAAFGGELLPLCAAMTPCRTMIVLPSLVLN